MVDWTDLPPPQLEVLTRGQVTITSGGEETVAGVADEGEQLVVFYGHAPASADGSDVEYHLDDDNTAGKIDLVFDEAAAGGDSVIDYTVVRIIP